MKMGSLKYRFQTLSIAEKLIAVNVVFFVIPFLIQTLFYLFQLPREELLGWIQLSAGWEGLLYRPWTLITYSFLHADFFHLFWNMLLLYYSGQLFLNLFSEQIFSNTYFMGVVLGGLVFVGSYAPLYGGSQCRGHGCIYFY